MTTNTQPIAVIARLLDLTERRVQQLAREGVIPRAERGRYDLVGAVRGYVRYLRDQLLRNETGVADYGIERARLIKARADLAEMEAAQIRGELIPAPEVGAAWIDIVARLRARLIVLPDKVAPVVHETETIGAARDVIRRAVNEALEELAATPVETDAEALAPPGSSGAGDDRAGGPEGGDAATGPLDQRLGG